ncbi:MAG: metallophosphoesterase [Elusimicrobiota bacterium]
MTFVLGCVLIVSVAAPAQVFRARTAPVVALTVPPIASLAPFSGPSPMLVPALAPVLVVPTPPVLAVSPSKPKDAEAPSLERARLEMASRWDGASETQAVFEDVILSRGKLEALRRLSEPLSTPVQLARLQRTPRPKGETFRFSVIGDAEPGRFWFSRRFFNTPGVFWKLLTGADKLKGDFIIQLGDMVSRGLIRQFNIFIRGLIGASLETPYLSVIGNHDRHRPHGVSNDRVYRTVFGLTDYAFDRGGWRFVVVDSSARALTQAQLSWLEGVVKPGGRTIVFTHVPPAPLGEWTDFGPFKGVGGFRVGAQQFMRLMSERGVARVYMGHLHGLGRLVRDGVTYVLSGGGGSPLFPGPLRRLHHRLSVEVGPEGVRETVHVANGASFPLR